MLQDGTVRVIEAEDIDDEPRVSVPETPTQYGDAEHIDIGTLDYPLPGFLDNIIEEIAPGKDVTDAKLVDDMGATADVDGAYLFAFPDGTLLFAGSDPTAKDAVPWFAFTVGPAEPIPAPESCTDALDLLKPPAVQDLYHGEDYLPGRHGEWWLLPTDLMPVGTVFNPGVSSTPYGPSPLGNHVPREYAFTVPDDVFMTTFRDHADAPASIQSPTEALDWTRRQLQKSPVPDGVPDWAAIRSFAGDVLVRGTIRHRDDDHFVENLGDVWHRAETHNIEVYTADAIGNVHLNYYGQ